METLNAMLLATALGLVVGLVLGFVIGQEFKKIDNNGRTVERNKEQ